MKRLALGEDDRPVQTERDTKSVSSETTLAQDTGDPDALLELVRRLSSDVSRSLERRGLQGRTVKVKLRLSDFTTFTRQKTMREPVQASDQIAEAASALVRAETGPGRLFRLVGVGVSGFDEPDDSSPIIQPDCRGCRGRGSANTRTSPSGSSGIRSSPCLDDHAVDGHLDDLFDVLNGLGLRPSPSCATLVLQSGRVSYQVSRDQSRCTPPSSLPRLVIHCMVGQNNVLCLTTSWHRPMSSSFVEPAQVQYCRRARPSQSGRVSYTCVPSASRLVRIGDSDSGSRP